MKEQGNKVYKNFTNEAMEFTLNKPEENHEPFELEYEKVHVHSDKHESGHHNDHEDHVDHHHDHGECAGHHNHHHKHDRHCQHGHDHEIRELRNQE